MRHDFTPRNDAPSGGATRSAAGDVAYGVLAVICMVAAAAALVVGLVPLLTGDLRGALRILVFLPLAVTGMTGAYERFVRGTDGHMFFHLALQVPICLLLHFLTWLV